MFQVDAATQAHNGCSNASPSNGMTPIVETFVVMDKTAAQQKAERVVVGEWGKIIGTLMRSLKLV